MDRLKKDITHIFRPNSKKLQMALDTNLIQTEFQGISLNSETGRGYEKFLTTKNSLRNDAHCMNKLFHSAAILKKIITREKTLQTLEVGG